ncbi:hypothetical protein H7J07_05175 [Mycobacterium koreense]|uniref:Uncharacterized protein n=1 Tax=Mycolicibacillus koreensis TaxID=1069220 RepID=A0A7I7SAS4_9MYCO|nr:hypothetical protein [Mycolicibacillus koreensis]MCV7247616.1 hypothetical protein [Mycolicibacillus koreensis]OSC32809.1 hypothetical protein B8W67_13730 [Mycolicibacillus koreensis]BBY53994.1 hypothetical protein MKOR_12450 [Mycolicibacillus koreensis]
MKTEKVAFEELRAGDRIVYREGVVVTLLQDREDDPEDFFGRDGMSRFWAQADGGEFGWAKFGPGGIAYRVVDDTGKR